MKIYIKNDGYKIRLWLPTSLLRSKFIMRKLFTKGVKNINPFLKLLPKAYKALKRHIRKYGHFILVDVSTHEGDTVMIKV